MYTITLKNNDEIYSLVTNIIFCSLKWNSSNLTQSVRKPKRVKVKKMKWRKTPQLLSSTQPPPSLSNRYHKAETIPFDVASSSSDSEDEDVYENVILMKTNLHNFSKYGSNNDDDYGYGTSVVHESSLPSDFIKTNHNDSRIEDTRYVPTVHKKKKMYNS